MGVLIVDTMVDIESDIFFSEEEYYNYNHSQNDNDLVSQLQIMNINVDTNNQEVDELCDQFSNSLKMKPFFKVKSENVYIRYIIGEKYIIIVNNRESYLRCHLMNNFQVLDSYGYVFRKVKSMGYLYDNKIVLKLVFTSSDMGEKYEESDSDSGEFDEYEKSYAYYDDMC